MRRLPLLQGRETCFRCDYGSCMTCGGVGQVPAPPGSKGAAPPTTELAAAKGPSIAEVYARFELPAEATLLAAGDLDAELPNQFASAASVVGYPPALLPLYVVPNGCVVGWWVDPLGFRRTTIVECNLDHGGRATEIFRSWAQLALHLVVQRILADGASAARVLAEALNVDLDIATRVASEGASPSAYLAVPIFADDPPWSLAPERYRGDWPFTDRGFTCRDLQHVAGLELEVAQQRALRTSVDTPPWLVARSQSALFARLRGADRENASWRSLNSPGWKFAHAKEYLSKLARYSTSERLKTLADAWTSKAHESAIGYGVTDPYGWWGYVPSGDIEGPAQIRFEMGHEHAPDSRLGAQRISLQADGAVEYERRQRGERWRHELRIEPSEYRRIAGLLRATPFPRVTPHQFPPGAGLVTLEATHADGRRDAVTFVSALAETAAYDDVVGALTAMIEPCAEKAALTAKTHPE